MLQHGSQHWLTGESQTMRPSCNVVGPNRGNGWFDHQRFHYNIFDCYTSGVTPINLQSLWRSLGSPMLYDARGTGYQRLTAYKVARPGAAL